MLHCTLYHPPGNEIYRSKEQNVTISVFEVDGYKERIWCQNLCYIAKLFLDHKTLQYDVDPFLFYCLTEVSDKGCHFVAYFSKEKYSEANNNVACILTIPAHQRKGYGKFLISLSYEISKIEKKWGSPEKPLSDLGRVSYIRFWSDVLMDLLIEKHSKNEIISIKQIQDQTAFSLPDIQLALKEMGVLKYSKGNWLLEITDDMVKNRDAKRNRVISKDRIHVRPCDSTKLRFVPYNGTLWTQRGRGYG